MIGSAIIPNILEGGGASFNVGPPVAAIVVQVEAVVERIAAVIKQVATIVARVAVVVARLAATKYTLMFVQILYNINRLTL